MKFFKKYILTLIGGSLLGFIFLFLFRLIDNSLNNLFKFNGNIIYSILFVTLYLLLIRILDDISDYSEDIIRGKKLFNIKILKIFAIIFSASIITISVIYGINNYLVGIIFYLIPLSIMVLNLYLDKEYLVFTYLPLIGLLYLFILGAGYYYSWYYYVIIFIFSAIIEFIFAFIKIRKRTLRPVSETGGKGYNLERLKIKNTPKFIIIPTSFLYPNYNLDDLKDIINSFCKRNKKYAVRSSAVDEDGTYSFAGIHDTYLNIKKDDVLENVFKVIASAKSDRALEYRRINHLDMDNIKIAVVIQEMVDADYAGIMFTINPVTNNMGQTIISVTNGLGDKLVDGSVSGSTYTYSLNDYTVDGDDILSKANIKSLIKLGNIIRRKTDRFQDIEFAIKGNKVYFLQARQIATYGDINPHNMSLLIDNSNIIESYYGITSPLTFSFALYIYERVYTETLSLGINKKKIDELKPYLSNMLKYYDGKIYYNMQSWYKVTSTLPSKNSLRYMEAMMGVKAKSNDFKRVKLGLFNLIHVGLALIKRLKNMDALSDEFINNFNSIILPYYGKEMNLNNDELIKLYHDIDKRIIKEFTTPILNDVAVMFNFGKLKEKLKNYPDGDKILARAINNGGEVESALNATLFKELVDYIRNDSNLYNDFNSLNKDELLNKYLNLNNEFSKMLNDYIYRFGSRVMNELKLETITMIEDKSILFEYLKNALDNENIINNEIEEIEIPVKLLKLSEKTRHYVQNRERLRLKRTYVFSVVRNIFLNLGRNYYKEKRIDNELDIFYLKWNEIFEQKDKYQDLIIERKKEELEYKNTKYYDRVAFYGNKALPISFSSGNGDLRGIPSGNGKVTAQVSYLSSSTDEMILGNIILAKRTDPGWISLFPLASGIIVEHGSMLSHSFVVAREMGLPAIVGVSGATDIIKDKDIVTLDAENGVISLEKDKEIL